MPYIAIKAYPKDDATKKKLVEQIEQVFLDVWKCPAEAISVSIEEVAPERWENDVVKAEILPNADKMMILAGEKKF